MSTKKIINNSRRNLHALNVTTIKLVKDLFVNENDLLIS